MATSWQQNGQSFFPQITQLALAFEEIAFIRFLWFLCMLAAVQLCTMAYDTEFARIYWPDVAGSN